MGELTNAILATQKLEQDKKEFNQSLALSMLQIELKNRAIDISASKDLYNENKKLYYDSLNDLQTLETSYGEAVGSLNHLGDMYKASGKEVTADIYKGEATNYQARADHHLENWQAVQNKIDILQESIFTDVKRAKNIMAGGFGFEGGADEEKWDIGDLGIVSYEAMYGKASPTVEAMFENNPGVMVKELANLQKTEGALKKQESTTAYYAELNEEKRIKIDRERAELILGRALSSSNKTSEFNLYNAHAAMQANLENNEENVEQIVLHQQARDKIQATIGAEFATLLGRPLDDTNIFELSRSYMEMHDVASPTTEVRTKTISGNFSIYNEYVQEANKNYQAAMSRGDNDKARKINELAIKYLGMPTGIQLNTFARDIGAQYSKTITGMFNDSSNDLIKDNEEVNEEVNEDLDLDLGNDSSWESLLDE